MHDDQTTSQHGAAGGSSVTEYEYDKIGTKQRGRKSLLDAISDSRRRSGRVIACGRSLDDGRKKEEGNNNCH